MLGHGTPAGLLSWGEDPYRVSYRHLEGLKDKPYNVYVWCNADKFVEDYDLHGFYTGMIVSEMGEAMICGIEKTEPVDVYESNMLFTLAVRSAAESSDPVATARLYYNNEYREQQGRKSNPVISYNEKHLYFR
jgi:hypothetical protein